MKRNIEIFLIHLFVRAFIDIRPDIRYPATTGYPALAIHLPDYPVSGQKSISGPTLDPLKTQQLKMALKRKNK